MAVDDLVKHKNHLNKLNRKFNLLSAWLQLKFPNDPSFPRSLIHDTSTELDADARAEYGTEEIEKPKNNDSTLINLVDIKSLLELDDDSGDIASRPLPLPPSRPARSRKQDLTRFRPIEETHPCSVHLQRIDTPIVANIEESGILSAKDAPESDPHDGPLDDEDPEINFAGFKSCQDRHRLPCEPAHQESNSCVACGITFSSSKESLLHEHKIHGVSTSKRAETRNGVPQCHHQCPQCEKFFSFKSALKRHVTKFHPGTTNSCEYVDQEQKIQKSGLPCPVCHKIYVGIKSLRAHIQHKHGDEKAGMDALNSLKDQVIHAATCEICDKKFKHFINFKRHLQRYHSELYQQKIQSGEIRNRDSTTESIEDPPQWNLHVQCPKCPKMILHGNLHRHMRYAHEQQKRFLCSQCGFSTKRKDMLASHVKTHSDVRKYKCEHCPYAAKQVSALWIHKVRHHDPTRTKNQCPQCGELFKSTSNLGRHIAHVHKNVRLFQCNFCEKSFKASTHLKYHIKTHQNPDGRQRGLNKEREPKRRAANGSQDV